MTEETTHVLLIEDNPADARLLTDMLAGEPGFRVQRAATLGEALELLAAHDFDAVVADLHLPDTQAGDVGVVSRVRERHPELPIVVVTVHGSEDLGVRAVSAGAQDYLLKDHVGPGNLKRSLQHALVRQELTRATRELERRRVSQEAAQEINDTIIQGLALAQYMLEEDGDRAGVHDQIVSTLSAARRLLGELLGPDEVSPGELRRPNGAMDE